MNRTLFLSLFASLFFVVTAKAQLQDFRGAVRMQFPSGYRVVKEARAGAQVVKVIPGPAEATVKGMFTNQAGVSFYLSDWSWDRRLQGQSHFWILPVTAPAAPPPPAGGVQVLAQPQKVSFPNGFIIVSSASANARQIATKAGAQNANVKAYIDRDGIRFYMSDWSFDRAQQGKSANWMRSLAAHSNRPETTPPPIPDLPPGLTFNDSNYKWVAENGFELISHPSSGAPARQRILEPRLISIAGEASGISEGYLLSSDQNQLRLQGKPFFWIREISPKPRPELLPRMKQLCAGHDLQPEKHLASPWRIGAQLMSLDPEQAVLAIREFGIEEYLADIAYYFEDREFPYPWLKEVARYLEEKGTLERSIATLRKRLPTYERIIELQKKTAEEMLVTYANDRRDFDIRMMAVFEAERQNHGEVEELLSSLIEDWKPGDDGLNASGPRINMLREIARAQWRQGKTGPARISTRTWLDAYARNLANDLLHPDFVDASQRFTEFDSDFEAVGEYFDLLEAVTDPRVAAEIVVGLKGLQLAVASSQQVRSSARADPEVDALCRELVLLQEQVQKNAVANVALDPDRERRLAEINADLAMRRLSGVSLNLSRDAEWTRLKRELERRRRAGDNSWEVDELEEKLDLIALDHIVDEGNFVADPAEVAESLRPGEVLIDFFKSPPATRGAPSSYGAVILSNDSPVQLVRLGEAAPIDAAVQEFRDLMLGNGPFSNDSLETLQEKTGKVVANGYDLLINPLLVHLETAKRLVICSESQLLFLPLDSLEPARGQSVGSRWEVTYVNAARDLLRERSASGGLSQTALLVGDPIFKSSPGPAHESGGLSLDRRAVANLAAASRGIEFEQLPGTREEITMLAPKLTGAGYKVVTLAGSKATEGNLKRVSKSPTILHFATHGFFLQELPVKTRGDQSERADSAMLTSGLALTGAQNTLEAWNKGTIPAPGNDGIFLASEVSRLDLSETKTVVLSACETAVGKALSGEGVEGLRSGLTLAGAESVVLTLWPVDDSATVEVMDLFYSKILAGIPAPLAMAQTKRELYAKWIKTDGTYVAHRLIGPFIVTRSGGL